MTAVRSDLLTNVAAGTLNDKGVSTSIVKQVLTIYEAAGALADNTVVLLHKVPVDAKITSVRFASDDLGSTGTINVGLYPNTIDSKALSAIADTDAVDEDCIATAIDVNAAAVAPTEVRFEAANIDTLRKKAWELAGLSARPAYEFFYLALTMAAASTAGGTIAVKTEYVD